MVFASLRRLRENGLTDERDEMLVLELERYVQEVQTKLFINHEEYVDGWYMSDAPVWDRVRELGNAALVSPRRAKTEKGGAT